MASITRILREIPRPFVVLALAVMAALPAPVRADEAGLVAPGAEIRKLAEGFVFTEGPTSDDAGNVWFTDIPNGRIHKWTAATGEVSIVREKSGGANGLWMKPDGTLIACEGTRRRVTATDAAGTVTVIAELFGGKKLNSPNDCWVDPKGGVYFTDPRYGGYSDLEQDGMQVYLIPGGGGELRRVTTDLKKPNGIIGTPDGARLYVADHGDSQTFQFDIQANGYLANKRIFAAQGSDGVTMDEKGNVYLTDADVAVYSPEGKLIQRIKTPMGPANVAFGGADHRMLFITARTAVFGLQMNVRGAGRN